MRERWGCDAPARAAVFATSCPSCLGWDPKCAQCSGRGVIRHARCPSSQTDATARFVVQVYRELENGNQPFDGFGWANLPDSLVRMLRVVGLERNRIEEERERVREAERKRNEARARSKG